MILALVSLLRAPVAHASGVVPEYVELPDVVERAQLIVVAKAVGAPEQKTITFPEATVPPYEFQAFRLEVVEVVYTRPDGFWIDPAPPTLAVGTVFAFLEPNTIQGLSGHLSYYRDGMSRWVIEHRYEAKETDTKSPELQVLLLQPAHFEGQPYYTLVLPGARERVEALPKIRKLAAKQPGLPQPDPVP